MEAAEQQLSQQQQQQAQQQQQRQPQQQRCVGPWALEAAIGQGSFAVVWRARHVHTGAAAAVKEIALTKLNAKLRQSLESEVSILKRISHLNIVELHQVIEESERLYLVMEYCAGGDLAHLLRRVKRLPEAAAQHLMRQLAAGLRQMWAHHLVHRDLKPQNLLLSEAVPEATLKIADFGFARNLQPQGLAETLCGSPLYMAPEILHFHKYDAKADLWSIGAILFEMVVGRPPFTGANQFQLLRNIERGDARVPEAIAASLSPACRHLIHCLLRRNPVERLSFEEFFRHPFVATAEEAAAPLPPRAPFGTASALLSSAPPPPQPPPQQPAAAGQPQQPQPHTVQFSTSPPAAAAAAAGLAKSRSATSFPQQVLGFQQAQQAQQAAPAGAGAAAPVPLGGLSHQLKPRRSLDLDGLTPAQKQQMQQQQQQAPQQHHQYQQYQQQRRPQPVTGHRLGSIQRVQGFQPAPLPGQQALQPQQQPRQQQLQQPASATSLQSPFGTAPAAAPAAAQQRQQAPAVVGLPPSGRPQSRQQQQPRAPLAPAAAAAGAAVSSEEGSEDEDYVMVDTLLSAHTARGKGSKQESPQASRTPSEEASLANSRHTYASTEEDIFAVHAADGPAVAAAAAAAAAGALPAWLATSPWHFLQRVAGILQEAGAAQGEAAAQGSRHATHQPLRECLSLHLAALQLLEHAMEAHSAAVAAAAAAAMPAAEDQQAQQQRAGSGACPEERDAAELAAAGAQLQAEAVACMQAAEAAAAALHKAGRKPSPTAVTPAAAAAAEAEAALPDPWELLYAAALGWGREAAVDELLGNQPRACCLYGRAGAALSFLCSEAAGLELEPPAELAPADRARLQKYAAATAVRWAAACAASGGGGGGSNVGT